MAYQADGHRMAYAAASYPTYSEVGGVVEQRPEDWWTAAVDVLGTIAKQIRGHGAVQALGLSGQIGTVIPLDDHGQSVVERVPTWQDLRAASVLAEIEGRFSADQLHTWLGMRLPPGANWPLPRLRWWTQAQPRVWERTRRILQVKDYIGWRLTGHLASDASSWRGLVHVPDGTVVPELLAFLGLPSDILPDRYHPGTSRGRVRSEVARALGLPASVEVAVGWNDFNSAALGAGVAAGERFDVAGTSDHMGVVVKTPIGVDDRLLAGPFLPGSTLAYGVTSASGGALQWARTCLGLATDARTWDQILEGVQHVPPGADGLLFLPYLLGERAPLWDSSARGAWLGLTQAHGPEHLIRAVMEDVAFHLQTIQKLLPHQATDAPYIKVVGGPTRVAVWNQIRADVWGIPCWIAEDAEVGCRGAAMLAAPIGGMDSQRLGGPGQRLEPDLARTEVYRGWSALFQEAYPRLHSLFQAIGHRGAVQGGQEIPTASLKGHECGPKEF